MGEKYTCFNRINWIYSTQIKQLILSHMALCFYDVLESIWHGFCQFQDILMTGDLLTNLDPPMTSLKVLSPEFITVFQSAGKHYRTGASSSSLVKLRGASYLHSVMADSATFGGGAELAWMDMSCKSMG